MVRPKLLKYKSNFTVRICTLGHVPVKTIDPLSIIPHYLEHQEFPYSKRREELLNNQLLTGNGGQCVGYKRRMIEHHNTDQVNKKMINTTISDALMVKCRIAGSEDDDFIEVEVMPSTYANLLQSCCEELEINSDRVYKLRKLPNVVIRNDKDVTRLVPHQEIELVLK